MESIPDIAVPSAKPAAPYIGGKRNLARHLAGLIQATPHRTYAEVFVGMAGVFLRRRFRPSAEVINDWSRDVATFYRVLQRHHQAFVDMLRWQLTSRAEFDRLTAVDPDTLTDLERAARFYFLQRLAFGGKVDVRHFGVSHHRPARLDLTRLAPDLADLHERLSGVIIERLPCAQFIGRYDTPETLFYLDPPYYGSERDYGPGMFQPDDFQEMAEVLATIQGSFILSLNDVPAVREIFSAFEIASIDTHYGIAGKGASLAKEVVITPRLA